MTDEDKRAEVEDQIRTRSFDETEELLVEELVEDFLEDPRVYKYVKERIESYNLDFDIEGQVTGAQEDLYCAYQGQLYHKILAAMIRKC